MLASRKQPVRIVAMALAVGTNAMLVAWLILDKPSATRPRVTPAMTWLALVIEPEPPLRKVAARRNTTAARIAPQPMPAPVAPLLQPPAAVVAPSPAEVDPAPSIDWSSARGEAVRGRVAAEESADNGSVLDSRPEPMELPEEKERPHKLGDSEFSNGRTIVWVNERCYLESEILDRHSMPRTVCKNRSMADRRSEDRADAIEQAVKQKRSGSAGK